MVPVGPNRFEVVDDKLHIVAHPIGLEIRVTATADELERLGTYLVAEAAKLRAKGGE